MSKIGNCEGRAVVLAAGRARCAASALALALSLAASAALAPSALSATRPATAAASSAKYRVGTFNIRCQTSKDKGARSWGKRKGEVIGLIRRMKCDVVGLQEVTTGQMRELKGALGEYGFVGDFRNRDRKSGEATPVCYLKSRFELLKSGTFWLSAHPDVPGSRNWGAAYPRNCAFALLRDRATGKRMLFANTHPDHKSAAARLNGVKVISSRLLRESEGAPVVLVGDHNCSDAEPPAEHLRGVFADAMYASKSPPIGPWRSFSGWHKRNGMPPASSVRRLPQEERAARGGTRIDYIYVSRNSVAVLNYGTFAMKRKGADEYFSDHFPVIAVIALK